MMDKRNFLWVWSSPYEFVDIRWIQTSKGTSSEYTLSIGVILLCTKLFHLGCAQGSRNSAVSANSTSAESATQTFRGLLSTARRSVVYNGFTSPYRLVWSRSCTDRAKI